MRISSMKLNLTTGLLVAGGAVAAVLIYKKMTTPAMTRPTV